MSHVHLKRVTFTRPVMTDNGTRQTIWVKKGEHLYLEERQSYDTKTNQPSVDEAWVVYERADGGIEYFQKESVASYSVDVPLNKLRQHYNRLPSKYGCDFSTSKTDPTRYLAMHSRVRRLQDMLLPHIKALISPEQVAKLIAIEPPEEGATMWDHLLEGS